MLKSAPFSYINLRKYLEKYGFEFNPYHPCAANKIIVGEPLTVVSHVNEVKSSHNYQKMVETFNNELTSCMDIHIL